MEKSRDNDKILSYNDVVLRRSDLDILNGPHFLNDRLIEFYFSYLSSCHQSEDILLVTPSIAFWIKECPDTSSLHDFLEPLHLGHRNVILFPINNNVDVSIAEGGSHWSLLVFLREANAFVHHDSTFGETNKQHAKMVYRAVVPHTSSGAPFIECSTTPKQVNSLDCGVYVIAIARIICHWYQSDGQKDLTNLWFPSMKEQITSSYVSNLRKEVLMLIRSLIAQQ